MEFRLIYQGKLPAEGKGDSRTKEKNILRKHFHRQLAALWKEHPFLSFAFEKVQYPPEGFSTVAESIMYDFQRCNRKFMPLIHRKWDLACSLDILFLRRDNPGSIVRSGGDIDNRLKVLFDGLRMPQVPSEMPDPPEADEDPFFCLLEDDSLITRVSVTTDRLIVPLEESERVHDVLLVITVKTLIANDGLFPTARLWR